MGHLVSHAAAEVKPIPAAARRLDACANK